MRLLVAILLLLLASPAWAQQSQGMSQAVVVSSCGGGAAPSGALTQLTMDTTGRLCQSGAGSNICAQAAAYLGRTTGGTEGGNAVNITTLICGLVTDGVWAKLDAFYVLAQQNQTDALLNLVSTSYSLTATGTPTFTSYVGFAGFSSSAYFDTGFNPTTAPSPNYQFLDASYGIWSYAVISGGEGACQMSGDNFSITVLYDKFTDGNFISALHSLNGSYPRSPTTITKGLFAVERLDTVNVHPYQNGVSPAAIANASNQEINHSFWVGGGTGDGFTAQTLSAAHIGGSLGGTLELALYNRLRTYMTAIGVP